MEIAFTRFYRGALFKKDRPVVVKSVERSVKERKRKREERKRRKAENEFLKQKNDKMDEIPF